MKSGVRQSSASQGRSTSPAQDPGPGLVCRPCHLGRPARPAPRRAPRGHIRFCVSVGTAPPREGQTRPCWCCLLAAFSKVLPKEPGQVEWRSCDGPIALGWECTSDITVGAGPCEPLCKRQTFCVSATQPDAPMAGDQRWAERPFGRCRKRRHSRARLVQVAQGIFLAAAPPWLPAPSLALSASDVGGEAGAVAAERGQWAGRRWHSPAGRPGGLAAAAAGAGRARHVVVVSVLELARRLAPCVALGVQELAARALLPPQPANKQSAGGISATGGHGAVPRTPLGRRKMRDPQPTPSSGLGSTGPGGRWACGSGARR